MSIPEATRRIFEMYNSIRGKDKKEFPFPYWDMVILTASDETQRKAYEEQIAIKLENEELPKGIPYIVYADPKGPKVGCGGSTMHVICELERTHGEALWSMRILLINAGGQSQRLPSASVLGKIFTPLPCGNPMYQLLDLKLASYIPLISKMSPGIFHAAADTIEVFDLGSENKWSFSEDGFTALAHPSSLEIGSTHGVYVLDPAEGANSQSCSNNFNSQPIAFMGECLEVLQKPSFERMREKNAVLIDNDGAEFVYTDSCFFFDHSVSKLLLEFYLNEKPLQCEIDGYGDFLQSLGPNATAEFTNDTKNVSKIEPTLVETRQKLFEKLKGTRLNVVALDASKFYHLGTTVEYIQNFCCDKVLAKEMGFQRQVSLTLTQISKSAENTSKKAKMDTSIKGVVMHSYLHPNTYLDESAIVEYCQFDVPITVKSNSLLSNCSFSANCDDSPAIFQLPPNVFMHTLSVLNNDQSKAATVIFGINDNIKRSVSHSNLGDLKWFGKSMVSSLNLLGQDVNKAFENVEKCSLWNAKIFPVCDSFSESFLSAFHMLEMVTKSTAQNNECSKTQLKFCQDRISLQEAVMRCKDTRGILDYRLQLRENLK